MIHNFVPSPNTKADILDKLIKKRQSLEKFYIHAPWNYYRALVLRFEDYKKYKLDKLWQVNIINPDKDVNDDVIGVFAIDFSLEGLFDKMMYRLNCFEDFYFIYRYSNGRYRQ